LFQININALNYLGKIMQIQLCGCKQPITQVVTSYANVGTVVRAGIVCRGCPLKLDTLLSTNCCGCPTWLASDAPPRQQRFTNRLTMSNGVRQILIKDNLAELALVPLFRRLFLHCLRALPICLGLCALHFLCHLWSTVTLALPSKTHLARIKTSQ